MPRSASGGAAAASVEGTRSRTVALTSSLSVASLSSVRNEKAQGPCFEATSARVLEEERARIARELHDVIAHSVSVMVVQAGAARTQLNGDGGPVRDSLLAIEQSGRQALEEMRRRYQSGIRPLAVNAR